MIFDSHTHLQPYSHDASQTIQQLLEKADCLGLAGVCTTDHYEKEVFYDGGREDIFKISEYFEHLLPIKRHRPQNAASLFIGIELGYLPHLKKHLAQIVKAFPFDAVILSLHILDGEDPFLDHDMFSKGKISLYSRYLERMSTMLRECPNCDIMGHFDYITRYSPFADVKMRYAEMPEVFDQLFQTLIELNIALEINTRTTYKLIMAGHPADDAWPDPAIIRRYIELGGQLISVGSDAHYPDDAGKLIPECIQWLKGLGCRQLVHYENRKPIFTAI